MGWGKSWSQGKEKVFAKFISPQIYENSEGPFDTVESWIHVLRMALPLAIVLVIYWAWPDPDLFWSSEIVRI